MATTPTTHSQSKTESTIKEDGIYISTPIKKLSASELGKSKSESRRLAAKYQFYITQATEMMKQSPFKYGLWKATTRKAQHYADKLHTVNNKIHNHNLQCILDKLTAEEYETLKYFGLRL